MIPMMTMTMKIFLTVMKSAMITLTSAMTTLANLASPENLASLARREARKEANLVARKEAALVARREANLAARKEVVLVARKEVRKEAKRVPKAEETATCNCHLNMKRQEFHTTALIMMIFHIVKILDMKESMVESLASLARSLVTQRQATAPLKTVLPMARRATVTLLLTVMIMTAMMGMSTLAKLAPNQGHPSLVPNQDPSQGHPSLVLNQDPRLDLNRDPSLVQNQDPLPNLDQKLVPRKTAQDCKCAWALVVGCVCVQ